MGQDENHLNYQHQQQRWGIFHLLLTFFVLKDKYILEIPYHFHDLMEAAAKLILVFNKLPALNGCPFDPH